MWKYYKRECKFNFFCCGETDLKFAKQFIIERKYASSNTGCV